MKTEFQTMTNKTIGRKHELSQTIHEITHSSLMLIEESHFLNELARVLADYDVADLDELKTRLEGTRER